MATIGNLFHTIFYQPILNIMVLCYHLIPLKNFGFAIIAITVLSRFILWPLTKKGIDSQKKMTAIQPKLSELQKKYAKDKDRLYQETMALYKEAKINPASGCLPLLLQFPFYIAIYQALGTGLKADNLAKLNADLYTFIPKLTEIKTMFLWFDMTKHDPIMLLPVLVAATQFLQAKLTMGKASGPAADAAKQSMLIMPVVFLIIGLQLPSGLNFYIFLSNLLAIFQQVGPKDFFRFAWLTSVFKKEAKNGNKA